METLWEMNEYIEYDFWQIKLTEWNFNIYTQHSDSWYTMFKQL